MIVDVLWRYRAVQLFFTRLVVTNSCSPTAIWTPTRICCSADSVCVSHSHRSRSSWILTQTWPETWWAVFKSRYSVAIGIDHLISVAVFILTLFAFSYLDCAFCVVPDHQGLYRPETHMQRVLWPRTRLGDVQKTERRGAKGNRFQLWFCRERGTSVNVFPKSI